jgi:hypothetical protein
MSVVKLEPIGDIQREAGGSPKTHAEQRFGNCWRQPLQQSPEVRPRKLAAPYTGRRIASQTHQYLPPLVLSAVAPRLSTVLVGPGNRSSGLHDLERDPSGLCKAGAMERGGDDLFVTAAGTEEITKFIMLATEAVGRVMNLEAPHTSDPSFDAAMILFDAVN